jgi:hypothetical protein
LGEGGGVEEIKSSKEKKLTKELAEGPQRAWRRVKQ